MADDVTTAASAHWFVCAVCGERGGCDGQDEDGRGDDGDHVHFRQECWEIGPPMRPRALAGANTRPDTDA